LIFHCKVKENNLIKGYIFTNFHWQHWNCEIRWRKSLEEVLETNASKCDSRVENSSQHYQCNCGATVSWSKEWQVDLKPQMNQVFNCPHAFAHSRYHWQCVVWFRGAWNLKWVFHSLRTFWRNKRLVWTSNGWKRKQIWIFHRREFESDGHPN